jgi:uncharacterized protein YggE
MPTFEVLSPRARVAFGFFACTLLAALTAWAGIKAVNGLREHKFIGVPLERNVISVSGEGKVVAPPDVAVADFGMSVERRTVAEAQRENTRVMNEFIAKLQEFGVDKKDVQTTSYGVNPLYDYTNGRTVLRGYAVSQNVHVKVRNLDKAGDLVGMAGELGLNQVGSLSFTIDEPKALRAEAREMAIADAREQAESLARAAGVKLRRVISFSENGGGVPMPYYYAKDMALEAGNQAAAPTLAAGSTEIVVNATITYEIE